jgi:hypothetical protein
MNAKILNHLFFFSFKHDIKIVHVNEMRSAHANNMHYSHVQVMQELSIISDIHGRIERNTHSTPESQSELEGHRAAFFNSFPLC